MPRFAQLADMEARFDDRDLLQLTDADGTYDAAKVTEALEDADAEINGYVASRHGDTALLEGNDVLRRIACSIAFHNLWRSDPPEWVEKARVRAERQLKDIASGALRLDQGVEVAPPRDDVIQYEGPEKRFSADQMRNF